MQIEVLLEAVKTFVDRRPFCAADSSRRYRASMGYLTPPSIGKNHVVDHLELAELVMKLVITRFDVPELRDRHWLINRAGRTSD
jgi:hypothetical protein